MSRADAAQLLHAPPAAGRGGGGGGERGGGGAGGDIAQRCTCETVDESTSTSTCLLALQVLSKYFFVPVKQVLLYLLPIGAGTCLLALQVLTLLALLVQEYKY